MEEVQENDFQTEFNKKKLDFIITIDFTIVFVVM